MHSQEVPLIWVNSIVLICFAQRALFGRAVVVSLCLKHYENVHSDNNLTLRATRILIYCSQSIYKYLHIQYLGNIAAHNIWMIKSSLKSCVIIASRLPEIHANYRSEIMNRVKHKLETATVCLQSQSCCFWNVLDLALQYNLYCKFKHSVSS